MDACEEVDVDVHAFLTSALDGGEWLASHPCCFTSKESEQMARCASKPF